MSAVAAERTTRCEECGEHFTPVRSTARYCGSTCRSRAFRRLQQRGGELIEPALAERTAVCASCGSTFEPTRRDALYCPGGACKQRVYRRRKRRQEPATVSAGLSETDLVARYGPVCPDIAHWLRRLAGPDGWFERVDGGYRMKPTRDGWLGREWWTAT